MPDNAPTTDRLNEKRLASGAVLGLQIADFDAAMALHDAIMQELIGVKIEGLDLEKFDPRELFKKDISAFKDLILRVVSSRVVRDALFRCAASCTYQGPRDAAPQPLTRNTFQPQGARADFYPVAGEVAVFNLAPFFESLQLPSWMQEQKKAADAPASPTG